MLTHLYVNNYKCFVNFTYDPAPLQLILGTNGTGKSTIFDIIENLKEFITVGGSSTDLLFPSKTLTRWNTSREQVFELGITGNEGDYLYQLVLEHETEIKRNRIKHEHLEMNHKPLIEFEGGDVQLYRDDHSKGPKFPFDWTRSPIATLPERAENTKLTWFRERLKRIYIFAPDPLRMLARSEAELDKPDKQLTYLVSWLRHLALESPTSFSKLHEVLKEVVEGLETFHLEKVSDLVRILQLGFKFGEGNGSVKFQVGFDELSDGQRNLIALYTILFATLHRDSTVLIDEPDNFVALRELQPWLLQIRDCIEDEQAQCLMISHHPELIDYLALGHGIQFYRDPEGPTRSKCFSQSEDDPLLPSEKVARGWE